nr:WD40 repeat domain-containing protein [Crocosphaera sp.]
HDALVTGWEKLLTWKKEEEETLILQRRLTPAAMDWDSQQQPRFLWHSNPRLDLLKKVAKSDDNWFNLVEAEFVGRSIRRKTFNMRRNWTVAIIVILGLSAGLIFSLIGQRNTLIEGAIASRNSAKNSLRLNHSLDGMIESLQAGEALQHPLVKFPLFKLLRSTDTIQEQIQDTLQWSVYRVKETNRMIGDSSVIVRSVVSPDHYNEQIIASAGEDGTIKLWDLQGKLLKSWKVQSSNNQPSQRIWNVTFSPTTNLLASSGEDGIVRLWNLDEIQKLPDIQLKQTPKHQAIEAYKGYDQGYVRYVSFSSDGNKLAIVEGEGGDGYIGLWDLQGNRLAFWKADYNKPPVNFAKTIDFYPNNTQDIIVTTGMDKQIKIWDINNIKQSDQPQPLLTLLVPKKDSTTTNKFPAWSAFFSPNGKHIVAAGDDGYIALWTSENGLWTSEYQKVGKVWQAHKDTIWNVAFSPNGQNIASGAEDGSIRIWNLKGEKLAQFEGHSGPVRSVKFTADSQQLVSSGDDGTTRLWNLPTQPLDNQNIASFSKYELKNNQGIFSPDNKLRAFVDKDDRIQVTDVNGKALNTFQDHIEKVLAINFSPNSQLLVSAGEDKTIRVWKDLDKKQQGRYSAIFQVYEEESQNTRQYTSDQNKITAIIFSPDNQKIIAGDDAGYIRIWDLKQNDKIAMWRVYYHAIETLSFSSDGNLLVTFIDQKGNIQLSIESFEKLIGRGCNSIKNYLQNNSDLISINSSLCKKQMLEWSGVKIDNK